MLTFLMSLKIIPEITSIIAQVALMPFNFFVDSFDMMICSCLIFSLITTQITTNCHGKIVFFSKIVFSKNVHCQFFFLLRMSSARLSKPCPFGLIKRLDPVVVIFFKKCQKNYKCWIKCISKKITTTGSTNTCNFFWK